MQKDTNVEWHTIKVDSDVFLELQRRAVPHVDTANDVLRKLLLKESSSLSRVKQSVHSVKDRDVPLVDTDTFVRLLLRFRFGNDFELVGQYRYMFESKRQLVYFQNYNKETDQLWYRISKKPRQDLAFSKKQAWLCLTNPAERYAYIIPMEDVEEQARRSKWSRDEFEIHIYPQESRWSELDWNIARYRFDLDRNRQHE